MTSTLEDCINSLRISSGKRNKFAKLESRIKDRFLLTLLIDVGTTKGMKVGFDNHKNHPRPHVHVDTNIGRISIAIDNGNILHGIPKGLKNKDLDEIKHWIDDKKYCLKLIYENIQNCKSKEDFEPIIDAMNKYL